MVILFCAIFCDAGLPPSLRVHASKKSQVPDGTPEPPVDAFDPEAVVRFTKSLYKELGNNWGNVTNTAEKFRGRFQELNRTSGGHLQNALSALFEIRMLDLQASVKHAKQMQALIDAFSAKPVEISLPEAV